MAGENAAGRRLKSTVFYSFSMAAIRRKKKK
jgi:hypothetical protein